MPKPTRDELFAILTGPCRGPTHSIGAVDQIEKLLDAWEAESLAERERGRTALEIVRHYADHKSSCEWVTCADDCSCGFDDAIADLSGIPVPSDPAASWEDVTASSEDEDVEQFNRDQRIRLEACEEALNNPPVLPTPQERARVAAARYPLKKRATATKRDPHGYGEWSVKYEREWHAVWRAGSEAEALTGSDIGRVLMLTKERIAVAAELLKAPWTIEEDTDEEETT